jgi:hypothetical protein
VSSCRVNTNWRIVCRGCVSAGNNKGRLFARTKIFFLIFQRRKHCSGWSSRGPSVQIANKGQFIRQFCSVVAKLGQLLKTTAAPPFLVLADTHVYRVLCVTAVHLTACACCALCHAAAAVAAAVTLLVGTLSPLFQSPSLATLLFPRARALSLSHQSGMSIAAVLTSDDLDVWKKLSHRLGSPGFVRLSGLRRTAPPRPRRGRREPVPTPNSRKTNLRSPSDRPGLRSLGRPSRRWWPGPTVLRSKPRFNAAYAARAVGTVRSAPMLGSRGATRHPYPLQGGGAGRGGTT